MYQYTTKITDTLEIVTSETTVEKNFRRFETVEINSFTGNETYTNQTIHFDLTDALEAHSELVAKYSYL